MSEGRLYAAENRLQLSYLAFEEGNFSTAETESKDVIAIFRAEQNVESEANALAVGALAALAQGSLDRARAAMERVETILPRVTTRTVHLRLVLTRARVEAASGRVSAALASARFALAQARRFGLGVTELDARLVVLQIELAAGSAEQAKARLEALEREAASKGLGLIVRKIRAQVAAEQRVRGAISAREMAVKALV